MYLVSVLLLFLLFLLLSHDTSFCCWCGALCLFDGLFVSLFVSLIVSLIVSLFVLFFPCVLSFPLVVLGCRFWLRMWFSFVSSQNLIGAKSPVCTKVRKKNKNTCETRAIAVIAL